MKIDPKKDKQAPQYGPPVPTKFLKNEAEFLQIAANQTGLSVSELIRRSVRLMKHQKQSFKSYAFILDLAA
jgi:hypothetical protein